MCGCSPQVPTGDPAATQARALTENQTSDPLVDRPALNPLSHTRQGGNLKFNDSVLYYNNEEN